MSTRSVPSANPPRAQGLFNLYKQEKKHEEKTKAQLDDLTVTSERLQRAKTKLIEKLLDIQLKDEATKLLDGEVDGEGRGEVPVTASGALMTRSNLTTTQLEERSKKLLHSDISASIDEARNTYPDGFMTQLDTLVHTDEKKEKEQVAETVSRYIEPHMEAVRRKKKKMRVSTTLESIATAVSIVRAQRQAELQDTQHVKAHQDAQDRAKRVAEAQKMLRKDLGNIGELLHCAPVEYKTDIGVKEAELNDLRKNIAKQRVEEEKLLQERQLQVALIDKEQAKLSAEVDAASQKLVLLQRELETKELDLQEMAESQQPGSTGVSWASSTMQLERDLSLAVEEEFHLRHDSDDVRKTLDMLETEKSALNAEVNDAIGELTSAQEEYTQVLSKLEERLSNTKSKLYQTRENEVDSTRKINELRFRILHRQEDIRRQKRDLRSMMNTTIAQLAVEDQMQSRLMAKSTLLNKAVEKAHAQADHHITSLRVQLKTVMAEREEKTKESNSRKPHPLLFGLVALKNSFHPDPTVVLLVQGFQERHEVHTLGAYIPQCQLLFVELENGAFDAEHILLRRKMRRNEIPGDLNSPLFFILQHSVHL